jgi:hypothetical protein
MYRVSVALTVALIVASSVARAQAPVPAAPEYDAKFLVESTTEYVGTTTFTVGQKGEVAGALTITGPLAGTGTLSGSVKDGTWTARIEFTLTAQACGGVVSGSATLPTDRKLISGTATITSSCAPDPQSATFTFTKK